MKNINWEKIVVQALWLAVGVGTIVLLGAALRKKENKTCITVKIEITGVEKDEFIDERDVMDLLNNNGSVEGKEMGQIDLKALENALKKNLWVRNAELFFDNNRVLHVKIEEREPVARVFTDQGNSFYIDSSGLRLPLSEKLSARVPVITNFPSDKAILSAPDSIMLLDVVRLGKYIKADSFWMAQVSQIVITPQATFEMIPAIGNEVVELGDADDLDNKFNRLYTFYKKAWLQNGINKYEKIYVQFANQVVAVQRGVPGLPADSAQVTGTLKGTVATGTGRLTSGPQAGFYNSKISNKNPVDSVKTRFKAIHKNVISVRRNKIVNKSLSHSHVSVKPVRQQMPSVNKNQPKALMGKE